MLSITVQKSGILGWYLLSFFVSKSSLFVETMFNNRTILCSCLSGFQNCNTFKKKIILLS